jgi:hypothetical protein
MKDNPELEEKARLYMFIQSALHTAQDRFTQQTETEVLYKVRELRNAGESENAGTRTAARLLKMLKEEYEG